MPTGDGSNWQSYRTNGGNGSAGKSGVVAQSMWSLYGVSEKVWNSPVGDVKTNQGAIAYSGASASYGENSGGRVDSRAPYSTIGDVLQYIEAQPQLTEAVQAQLYQSGYFGKKKPTTISWGRMDNSTRTAALSMLKAASRNGSASWQEYLFGTSPNLSQTLGNAQSGGGSGGGGSGGSGTQTSVNLSNRDQSQNYLTGAMTNLLGRNPTTAEITKFQAALNGQEKAHPNVTTTDYSGRSATSSSSGGVDGSQEATNYTNGTQFLQEKDHHQIGSYMNALQSLLGGNTG